MIATHATAQEITSIPPRAVARGEVAIVIPCYRVAKQIAGVIRSIPARFDTILCVDDASPDETAEVVTGLADPRVTLLRRNENGGVGAAVKTGYEEALRRGCQIIVKMDGDGQMSADDLDDLIAPLRDGTADYAKGNRFIDIGALRRMPRVRLIGNAALSFLGKASSGYWNVLDVTNGYTAIRADALKQLDLARLADRYFFETSMLIELNIAGARVTDVEMPARYGDEQSSMKLSRVLMSFPALLARGSLRRFYWRYLIEDFGAVSVCVLAGAPLVLFGTIFGLWHWAESIRDGVPATAGTVLVAALPVILGFQLLLTAVMIDVGVKNSSQRRRGGRTPRAAP
jgi:glycosyltransferase involved in cell wall biosynthesis